jgi:hypothetical protein
MGGRKGQAHDLSVGELGLGCRDEYAIEFLVGINVHTCNKTRVRVHGVWLHEQQAMSNWSYCLRKAPRKGI